MVAVLSAGPHRATGGDPRAAQQSVARADLVESGFDDVPLARRAEAYRMNREGWTIQTGAIKRYVAAKA
jgi:hypothetical protein